MSTASEGGLRGRFISPSRPDLARLSTPLNDGEWRVLDFFDEQLPPEWEIYVQPHMNNLRPDFVLLNPNVGIAVYEVKDWNLRAMEWHTAGANAEQVHGTERSGAGIRKQHPIMRLRQYRDEISTLYCPRLGRHAGLAAVTAGLIFPSADEGELKKRLETSITTSRTSSPKAGRYLVCIGRETLEGGLIERALPDAFRRSSWLMNEALAHDLRHWLVEPDVSAEQREEPRLTVEQRRFVARGTDTGYRRLRGPAGSGKTMVLAARAARLAQERRRVLVISFNLTLLNYLQDCAVRFGCPRKSITWFHFHGWCKRVMLDAGLEDAYYDLFRGDVTDNVLAEDLPRAVTEAIAQHPDAVTTYDAILVDEGQNMQPNWWSALRNVLAPHGEMLLVADRAQDVYGRNTLWTEHAMDGAGFRGPWATLEPSFRMPARLTKLMAEYIDEYLSDSDISPPQVPEGQLDVDVADLCWEQTTHAELGRRSTEAVFELLARSPTDAASTAVVADVVVLADNKELGREIVRRLRERNVQAIATFSKDWREERQEKVYFFKGDARVKATTFHSFQGWEARCLVVAIDRASTQIDRHGIYVALTRLKAHPRGSFMTVVCAAPELAAFGRRWNQLPVA